MRKILLGTTAVVGAALLAPTMASAQQAPTVRLGGSMDALYGYTQQSGATNDLGINYPANVPANSGSITSTGATGTGTSSTSDTRSTARLGKHDFAALMGANIFVDGKAANGLTYGAEIRLAFSNQEGRTIDQRRASNDRTTAFVDEAFIYIASPTLGQVRLGDEDGAYAQMVSGIVTDFGTGGVYGAWQNFGTRAAQARTTSSPGDLGDNTKVIYLSPQFMGFDFGASFAFNYGNGGSNGCPTDSPTTFCDRAYAATGATNAAIAAAGGGWAARRNEYQVAARWRGNLGGIGLGVTAAWIGATAQREMIGTTATMLKTMNDIGVYALGAQASAYGVTVGANWEYGDANYYWGNNLRGGRPMNQYFLGASYTNGPITVGTNYVFGTFEGTAKYGYTTGNASLSAASANGSSGMQRSGMAIGGTYRLAPGLSLVAEYAHYRIRENGVDFVPTSTGTQSQATQDVFIAGARLAF